MVNSHVIYGQFEYGVSWERPTILPIWEAQVGVPERQLAVSQVVPLYSLETSSTARRWSSTRSSLALRVSPVCLAYLVRCG